MNPFKFGLKLLIFEVIVFIIAHGYLSSKSNSVHQTKKYSNHPGDEILAKDLNAATITISSHFPKFDSRASFLKISIFLIKYWIQSFKKSTNIISILGFCVFTVVLLMVDLFFYRFTEDWINEDNNKIKKELRLNN